MGAEGQGVPDGLLDKLTAELEETHAARATQFIRIAQLQADLDALRTALAAKQ